MSNRTRILDLEYDLIKADSQANLTIHLLKQRILYYANKVGDEADRERSRLRMEGVAEAIRIVVDPNGYKFVDNAPSIPDRVQS